MRAGPPYESVCKFLGLTPGQFHLIRRSNLRYDIQIIYHEIQSAVNGTQFPELDWVLTYNQPTLIFCQTIRFGAHVHQYLISKDAGNPTTLHDRIRTYNSVNWSTYNEETCSLMESKRCRVVVATAALSVGVDVKGIMVVVTFGDPPDEDTHIQMCGRIHPTLDGSASNYRCITYFFPKAKERALKAIEAAERQTGQAAAKTR